MTKLRKIVAVWAAWKQGVESIIETGRRLIEMREQFKDERGKWSQLVGRDQWKNRGLLPFGNTHAQRLIGIAGNRRIVPHVARLPSDSYTLYQLTRLSGDCGRVTSYCPEPTA